MGDSESLIAFGGDSENEALNSKLNSLRQVFRNMDVGPISIKNTQAVFFELDKAIEFFIGSETTKKNTKKTEFFFSELKKFLPQVGKSKLEKLHSFNRMAVYELVLLRISQLELNADSAKLRTSLFQVFDKGHALFFTPGHKSLLRNEKRDSSENIFLTYLVNASEDLTIKLSDSEVDFVSSLFGTDLDTVGDFQKTFRDLLFGRTQSSSNNILNIGNNSQELDPALKFIRLVMNKFILEMAYLNKSSNSSTMSPLRGSTLAKGTLLLSIIIDFANLIDNKEVKLEVETLLLSLMEVANSFSDPVGSKMKDIANEFHQKLPWRSRIWKLLNKEPALDQNYFLQEEHKPVTTVGAFSTNLFFGQQFGDPSDPSLMAEVQSKNQLFR